VGMDGGIGNGSAFEVWPETGLVRELHGCKEEADESISAFARCCPCVVLSNCDEHEPVNSGESATVPTLGRSCCTSAATVVFALALAWLSPCDKARK